MIKNKIFKIKIQNDARFNILKKAADLAVSSTVITEVMVAEISLNLYA